MAGGVDRGIGGSGNAPLGTGVGPGLGELDGIAARVLVLGALAAPRGMTRLSAPFAGPPVGPTCPVVAGLSINLETANGDGDVTQGLQMAYLAASKVIATEVLHL